jgi:DNA-directed RNA polymerase specialized sigma24 family protein
MQLLDTLSGEERLVCLWKKVGFSSQDIADHWGWSSDAVDELFAQAVARIASAHVAGAVTTSGVPAGVRSDK